MRGQAYGTLTAAVYRLQTAGQYGNMGCYDTHDSRVSQVPTNARSLKAEPRLHPGGEALLYRCCWVAAATSCSRPAIRRWQGPITVASPGGNTTVYSGA